MDSEYATELAASKPALIRTMSGLNERAIGISTCVEPAGYLLGILSGQAYRLVLQKNGLLDNQVEGGQVLSIARAIDKPIPVRATASLRVLRWQVPRHVDGEEPARPLPHHLRCAPIGFGVEGAVVVAVDREDEDVWVVQEELLRPVAVVHILQASGSVAGRSGTIRACRPGLCRARARLA